MYRKIFKSEGGEKAKDEKRHTARLHAPKWSRIILDKEK